MHVTLYPIPFADFLDNQLHQLNIDSTTHLTLDHSRYTETTNHFIIFAISHILNLTTQPSPHITKKINLSISPTSIHINLFPVILYLTRNEALKFIDTFITLCHTTHPNNKNLLGDLYQIRQLITLSGET